MLSFSSCFTTRKGLYRQSWHLKPISLGQDLHQLTKQKKAYHRPLILYNAASSITHSAIADQHSLRVLEWPQFNLQCTLYSTLYSGNFQRKISESWPDAQFGDTKHRRSTVHGAAHACMAWPIYGSGSLVHVMSMCQLQEPRDVTLRAQDLHCSTSTCFHFDFVLQLEF